MKTHRQVHMIGIRFTTLLALAAIIGTGAIAAAQTFSEEGLEDLGYRKSPYGGGWYLAREVSLEGVRVLVIESEVGGNVDVVGSDSEVVRIALTHVVNSHASKPSRDAAARVPIEIRTEGDQAIVRASTLRHGAPSVAVHIAVQAPRDLEVRIVSPAGSFSVDGLRGPYELRAESANVELRETGSEVKVLCGSATIEAWIDRVDPGHYSIGAKSATISLHVSQESSVRVRAEVDEGRVETTYDAARVEDLSLELVRNGGQTDVQLRAATGSIFVIQD